MQTKNFAEKLEKSYETLLTVAAEKEVLAITILQEIAENEQFAASVRTNAATSILDHAHRCREYFNSKQLQSKLEIAREMRENLARMIEDGNNF